jgi:hypothetical protein
MATLSDYRRFHGMLCGPFTSRRCCNSFNGILFMPSDYAKKGVHAYHSDRINILTYYGLVVASITGLSSLLGATEEISVEENLTKGLRFDKYTEITPEMISFLGCSTDYRIVRRFNFNFCIPSIRVQMFHVFDPENERLCLIEIYEKNSRLTQLYAVCTMGILSILLCW